MNAVTLTEPSPLILQARNVAVDYPSRRPFSPPKRVLENVSLDIRPGETVGLVGESGSGKSTLGRAILGLSPIAEGTVHFGGQDITHASMQQRRRLAKDLQVVFQDPYGSLNPAMRIRDIILEPVLSAGGDRGEAQSALKDLLDRVQLPADTLQRYPSEFSGGQRQRIAIARALIMKPKLIVCDEVVSALDLSTQARILELLIEIQADTGVSYLFTSHDLGVIRAISHTVTVLFRGRVVESGDVAQVTESPSEAYTKQLLMASPVPDPARQRVRRVAYRKEFIV
ncbi:MAG TPA: ATP-binding cassette domain-containing protein [Glaciihabitans sp.]|jgi:peptide/nickel transport system ATP-binding protein|nr:ATP-binding cassette domain-containing protein [Glaciihabitans sp.]